MGSAEKHSYINSDKACFCALHLILSDTVVCKFHRIFLFFFFQAFLPTRENVVATSVDYRDGDTTGSKRR